jgi:CubicO group peptidase (beta-lactamase class C family)
MHRRVCVVLLLWLFACLAHPADVLAQSPLPTASPESEGFDPGRLALLDTRVKEFVDAGKHAGIGLLVARDGKIVDWKAWGQRDRERNLPMERDTIVRIYSMSKAITSVAVMQLFEQGRLKLDDPLEKYLPSFAKPKVFVGGTAKVPRLVAAKRSITIKDLLTHTSGYNYANMYSKGAYDDVVAAAKVEEAPSLDEAMARLAKLPLAHQPGERFSYGLGLDILGAVVQKITGQPFGEYVVEHICAPLKMVDTAYSVPEAKRERLAKVYSTNKQGALEPVDRLMMTSLDGTVAWGGAGMFSTIGDYARFGQMLLNGGELDGVRILGRKTVELMEANQLNHLAKPTNQFSDADGFGFGGAVRIDLAKGNRLGSVGQFGWTGAATTYFNIDPAERTMVLFVAQHFPRDEHGLFLQASTLFYASLVK